jgi:RNA polymerase primary sigma factor
MEMSKMSARGAKVKLARKGRPAEAGRKMASTLGRRPARDGKGKVPAKSFTDRAPIPANDTMPVDALGAPGADPAVDEIEVEALGATPGVEIEADETDEVTAEEARAGGPEAEDDEDEDEEQAPETDAKRRRGDEEPASFLAMYFRDMAELDVLRPEQEFETARNIEEMELNLWKTILGFAPGTDWILDVVEREVGKPLPEAKVHRAVAARARHRSSIQARDRFGKTATGLAIKLRALDIDRIFLDAALSEIQRVGRAVQGLPYEGTVPFSTSTKAFADFVRMVSGKAFRLKAAKNEFVKANLRLVVSIARRFNYGRMPLADLIQEGNIGLIKAVERYDYRRGYRFSTYASWWIRHAISRALADKGRAVRLPVHMIDAYHRVAKSKRELSAKLGRQPTSEEIADVTGIAAPKIEKMRTFLLDQSFSLDRTVSDEDGRKFIDFIQDPNAENRTTADTLVDDAMTEEVRAQLDTLKPIEADILRQRFGLDTDKELTLKEIGEKYNLSRERIRQLQEQALTKMRRALQRKDLM